MIDAPVSLTARLTSQWRALSSIGRAAITCAFVASAWATAHLALPQGAPIGVVINGTILGAATALASMGLILLYRSSRVINFAYGSMGAALGLSSLRLFLIWKWPYPVAILVGVMAGAALGLLIEFVVIRRFNASSRLVLSVATIGLTQLLGGIEILLPPYIFGEGNKAVSFGGYVTPLSSTSFSIGSTVINGDHLLILAVAPLVVVALAWFLKRSAAGMAIRAAAENSDRARLLGIPVGRINLLVWGVAGALAALTFFLKGPFIGTIPTAATGPAILLPALAAALVARMESLPTAFVAALVLGAIDQVTRWNTTISSLSDVVLLIVIVGALLSQRSRGSRALDNDSSWQDSGAARPVPIAIRKLRTYQWSSTALIAALGAVGVVMPLFLSPSHTFTLTIAVVWGIVAVSLVVLTGWNGQISLGQFALVGVGAVIAGNLMADHNVDLFVAMAVAAGGTALVALLLGFPALRIRGPFLAVVTLSFAVVLDGYVLNPDVFPSLIPGDIKRPVLWQRWDLADERTMYWFCLATLAVVLLAVRGVRRSRTGRLLIATRDNRKASEAMSVPSRWISLSGFVFSGAIAGLAGALNVVILEGVRVQSFPPTDSVDVFSWTTIGGMSSAFGGFFGGGGLRAMRDVLASDVRLVVSGVGMLVVLWIIPGGLAQLGLSLRDRFVRVLARTRGIVLDGLSSDSVDAASTQSNRSAEPDESTILSASGMNVSYGQLQVLFDVSIDVRRGEILALLGTNGAGKSTVLKAMVGLVPSKGTIRLGEHDLTGLRAEEVVRRGVALMPGGKSVFPTLTVDEHLRLAAWTFRADRARITQDTAAVLELFPSLQRRQHNMAGDMSGGEQQQLALAQTLLLRPSVLLIDELSLGLAPTIVAQLLDVVRSLNAQGTTIVVVEQSVNVALALAERALFMEKGQVRFEGATRELLERPDILRSVFLKGAAALSQPVEPSERDESAVPGESAVPDDAPGELETIDLDTIDLASIGLEGVGSGSGIDDGPVLSCVGVVKRFGGVLAVDAVDLHVMPGEIVGLVGQNGAGKTTLLDCISGFHDINGGTITFRGRDISGWAPHERARARLGRSFQEARLFPSLTVAETISVACERQVASRSLVADALRQPASYESELTIAARTDRLVGLLGLTDHRDKLTSELSTGTRRIVELACLLAEDPVVLLLDEPSAGVAQRETEALGPLLSAVRDATGVAMVVIEHDMPLLSGLCDRLVALDLGAVIATGEPNEVLADPAVISSYLGTDQTAINRSGVSAV